jgi:hypothetical protein
VCDACGEEAETEDNLMVECDKCRVMVSNYLGVDFEMQVQLQLM